MAANQTAGDQASKEQAVSDVPATGKADTDGASPTSGSMAQDLEKGRFESRQEKQGSADKEPAGLEDKMILCPDELKFLCTAEYNPDLTNPENMKQGNIQKGTEQVHVSVQEMQQRQRCGHCRGLVGFIVYSYLVQTIVLLIILLDLVLTVLSFTDVLEDEDGNDHKITEVGDLLVVIGLSLDVLARFFVEGWKFLKSKMNIFELILVPVTIIEVFALKNLDAPLPLLRTLRPILRGTRILRLIVRTAGKGRSYLVQLRHSASGDRLRFVQDNFDLDLAYITPQIIAMPKPAIGSDSIFYNPVLEVARFFNERHGNNYLIVNVMEDEPYPTNCFFNRYIHFPIAQDGVPKIERLKHLCVMLDQFLKLDASHMIAVSSKHGQGRAALVVIALLLHRGNQFHTVSEAIHFFEHNRVHPDHIGPPSQTLDSASQRRFLEYFCNMTLAKDNLPSDHERPVKLKKISVLGATHYETIDIYGFGHMHSQEEQEPPKTRASMESLTDEEHLEGNDPNALLEKTLDVPQATIMERLRIILEESSQDSQAAGCQKQIGQDPIFSSLDSENLTNPGPGVWVMGQDLCHEFCIEVHRRIDDETRAKQNRKSHVADSAFAGCIFALYVKLQSMFCFCCAGRKKKEQKFDGGLLFACWCSSNFIELDEVTQGFGKSGSGKSITVNLDRYQLDKGAGAPSLRTYSANLQVKLEFEVENRIDWKNILAEAEADGGHGHLMMSGGFAKSEPFSLGWLSWVSEKIWPSFEKGFEKMIRDSLEPALASIPYFNVSLSHCSFGGSDFFPKFPTIQACSRTHDDQFEVQLDILLQYSTETDIVIDAGITSFGINFLRIDGLLSLKFRPILQEIPVFVAMQLLFLNSPELDLKFARTLEAANNPVIREYIFGAIDKAISDLLVLPNIMNINWGDTTSTYDGTISFQNVLPCSVARICIVQGRDVYAEHSLLKRSPDCFVKLKLGGMEIRTGVIEQSNNPIWNEEFDFLVYDTRQHVKGAVKHLDIAGRERKIGNIKGEVSEIVEHGEEGFWVPLSDCPNHGHNASQLLLRVTLFDLVPDTSKLKMMAKAAAADAELARQASQASRKTTLRMSQSTISDVPMATPDKSSKKDKSSGSPDDTRDNLDASRGSDAGKDDAAPEDDDKAQHLQQALNQPSEKHAGAVALLIFEVFGGRVPDEFKITQFNHVTIQSLCGSVKQTQACQEAGQLDLGEVSEKQRETIEKLSKHGLANDVIADSMGIEQADVDRLVRKRGWNLQAPQKASLLLHPADIENAVTLDVALIQKKKVLADGSVPLRKVLAELHAPKHDCLMKLKPVVKNVPKDAAHLHVELDVSVRMFVLVGQEVDEKESFL